MDSEKNLYREGSRVRKEKYIASFALFTLVFLFSCFLLRTKLTYLEFKQFNTSEDEYITVENIGDTLVQEFEMPYELVNSISLQVNTFAQDNNSVWEFQLIEADTNKVVYEDEFGASLLADGEYNRIKFGRNIKVSKGGHYFFRIVAKDASSIYKLGFYCSDKLEEDAAGLNLNGEALDSGLCFQVYGGDVDVWWCGFAAVLFAIACGFLARCYAVEKAGNKIKDDWLVWAIVVAVISFILLAPFATAGEFSDESDNMYGGMIIAQGGVLYRDYVTQHTPFSYYLCAVFALLGAGSVQQFRLSFYLMEAIIWGLAYIRHSKYFGRKIMLLLPAAEIIGVCSVLIPYGTQLLSDRIQGICMVLLLLELLRYIEDKRLDWGRCIIVSCCIWGSFGAAFVSIFALIWVGLVVLILEVKYWCEHGKVKLTALINRYYKLVISVIVPLLCAVLYFQVNHALGDAFEQFYTFNREVYPQYNSGLGDSSIVRPFIEAVCYFFSIMASNFNAAMTLSITNAQVIQLAIMVSATAVLVVLFFKKQYWQVISLAAVLIFSATRGYFFHGIAAWYVAILIIVLGLKNGKGKISRLGILVAGILVVVLLDIYADEAKNNLLSEQQPISDMESAVILFTENDEDKDVYFDALASGVPASLYYFYKGRYPVNRVIFMLPWYMDWYEQDDIEAMKEKRPRVVMYGEEGGVWGYTNYSVAFAEEVKKYYVRAGEEGWTTALWIRKD